MSKEASITMHARDMQRLTTGQRIRKGISLFGTYLFLGLMAVIILISIYNMVKYLNV